MFSFIIYIIISAIGFMMAFLYRRSTNHQQFFNPRPQSYIRWFTIVFGIAMITAFVLSYYTMNTLNNVSTLPEAKQMKYNDLKSIMVFVLNLGFLLLVILANAYSLSLKKMTWIPYLLAFGFYAIFIIKDAYYISDYFQHWQQTVFHLDKDAAGNSTLPALSKCIFGFITTALNAGMTWWVLRK